MGTADNETGGKKRKRGSISSRSEDLAEDDDVLMKAKALAKKEFEANRAEILDSLTLEYKNMFGQIGFALWTKTFIPVLIMSPFDVPPGAARNRWMDGHGKMTTKGRLADMPYLIYWYGSESGADCYSVIGQKQFVTYEAEKGKKSKSAYKLPERIQAKLDVGTTLTGKDVDVYRSYAEMEEDLLKQPEDRKRGTTDFPECYELLTHKDLVGVNLSDEDDDDDEAPFVDEPDGTKKPSSSKKESKTEKVPGKRGRPKKARTDDNEQVDSKGVSNEPVDSDEAQSGDAVMSSKPAATTAKRKPGRPKKSEVDTEQPVKAKRGRKKSDSVQVGKGKKISDEEKAFKQCQQAYLKLVLDWRACVESKDLEGIESRLEELSSVVDMFSVKFATHYELDALLLQAKAVYEENESDTTAIDALTAKLHESQASKTESLGDNQTDEIVEASTPLAETGTGASDGDDVKKDRADDDDRSVEYAIEDALSSHDEEDDEFVDDDVKLTEKESKRKAIASRVGKEKPDRKEKPEKRKPKVKHKIEKPLTEKQLKRKEKEAFMACEKNYLPMLNRWKSALKNNTIEILQEIISEADGVVKHFSATFILAYELSDICKETKKVLKLASADLSSFYALKEKIKEVFERKQPHVPKGYMPSKATTDHSPEFHNTADNLMVDMSQRSIASNADSRSTDQVTSPKQEHPKKRPVNGAQKLGDMPTPSKNIPHSRSGGSVAEESAVVPVRQAAQPKPERKKFTLGSLMRPAAKETIAEGTNTPTEAPKPAALIGDPAPLPSWVRGPSALAAPNEDPRALALEFLMDMAEHFPEGSVCVNSFARSLEVAIYDFARRKVTQGDDSWTVKYWDKVHLLVAAICGKTEKGTLQDMILEGRFDAPEKLVALREDKLEASFDGQPFIV